MSQARQQPKIVETRMNLDVLLREAMVGRCCEVLHGTAIECAELGDYSYLGTLVQGCLGRLVLSG